MFKTALKALSTAALITLSTAAFAGGDEDHMTQLKDIEWTQFGNTPIHISVLWGDRDTGPYGMYLKMPGGFHVGEHGHSNDYYAITVQGQWEHTRAGKKEVLPVGSYVMQPGAEFHDDACVGPKDCILLVVQNGKGDVLLPQ
ncbi:DUF4437 domain-containing protein [Pseudovibrio sp. Ad26]|uniref:cupin domain-containing protein n=1 Tax=Pseudovibrio sp. Ad26 TaxID=989410 RepID=UPI0007AE828E|nr:DUF4437 domain-containing protein [Pseudovibrio sp. Ad26]KZL13328.1 hypothetical protein PsAD26_02098 [Pseudovibrio sp. Ad26]